MLGDNRNRSGNREIICAVFLMAIVLVGGTSVSAATPITPGGVAGIMIAQDTSKETPSTAQVSIEDRIAQMEKMQQQIEATVQRIDATSKADETRGYENKMMARELIRYVKVMVTALAIIAVGFPFMVWLLSKKRLLGLSGLSQEVSATLLVVEERQAKLANILKEIQGEIDYVHSMSVPDLQKLIKQAENYLQQNETDLTKSVRDKK